MVSPMVETCPNDGFRYQAPNGCPQCGHGRMIPDPPPSTESRAAPDLSRFTDAARRTVSAFLLEGATNTTAAAREETPEYAEHYSQVSALLELFEEMARPPGGGE